MHIVLDVIIKTIVYFGNIWVLWFTFHGAVFLIMSVTVLGAMTSKECLHIFLNKVESGREIFRDALLYREIYIINIFCNSVQQKFLKVLMGLAIIILSISLNLLVMLINRSSHEDTNLLIVAFFGLVVVECVFVVLIIFEGMVGVYKESKRKLRICKSLVVTYKSVRDRRWLRRYLKSCNVLKIKFGDGNFFEELTLLRCLDLALNLSIQLILLSRIN